MKFADLGLSLPLLAALDARDYDTPTPIQAQAIPPVLEGKDLLGIAQTGTGKTAAFVLPSIQRLVDSAPQRLVPGRARMLVLAPTRELASQIADSARAYAQGQHVRVGVVFGGIPVPRSIREVSRGLDILVATPGRLLDLVDQRALDLSGVEILVLDEADQMLDLGFIHDLKRVVKIVPEKRQTLFFSATMPRNIRQLADRFCTRPVEISVTPVSSTAEKVSQAVTFVNQKEKQALLTLFFQHEQIDLSLVFSRTKHGCDRIVRRLKGAGIEAVAIHGNKSQAQRTRALEAFRRGDIRILVATDIAARGIDIPGVSHVVNFDLPNVPEQYVHRIGRTARAGREGVAYSFCDQDERPYLKDIEKLIKQRIGVAPLPENFNASVQAIAAMPEIREDSRKDGRDDRRGPRPPRRRKKPAHAIKQTGHRGQGPKKGGKPGGQPKRRFNRRKPNAARG
ncbi:DEAD/DEAH box helicase [Sphingomicrobium clamense]|uniref:DEAD/DEAH box helicase n=1 Tax=Sphingomicrobium clamense TaxID=2851013 RepID=A0ABS6V2V1_9SPHN|nr:DEAD/DEAH box helicase [Sphingomicrobium sp. B8]MBW0143869.1 DEAD/DEAH box helicase [Sphingomicrobium sp. B8]